MPALKLLMQLIKLESAYAYIEATLLLLWGKPSQPTALPIYHKTSLLFTKVSFKCLLNAASWYFDRTMLNTLLSGLACKSPWLPYSPIALSLVLSLALALAFALTLALGKAIKIVPIYVAVWYAISGAMRSKAEQCEAKLSGAIWLRLSKSNVLLWCGLEGLWSKTSWWVGYWVVLVVFSDGFGNFLFFACCLVLYLRFWQFFMFLGFVCDLLLYVQLWWKVKIFEGSIATKFKQLCL